MPIPQFLVERFPPSPKLLLDLVRKQIDDSMVMEVAKADYGIGADECFRELRSIRDTGLVSSLDGISEVLSLTRFSDPDRPNLPPFEPGPSGERGHQVRLFACSVLLYATAASESQFYSGDGSEDSTVGSCLVSARDSGEEINAAIASYLTWKFSCFSDCYEPALFAAFLLIAAFRMESGPLSEQEKRQVADWVLNEDFEESRRTTSQGCKERPPIAFGVQMGFCQPLARELEARAATIAEVNLRESVQLCAQLLIPSWLK